MAKNGKVMAQGVFDVLHPGHLHYLKESKKLGDELIVLVARDSNTSKETCLNEEERLQIIESLDPVDKAVLGHKNDIYKGLKNVNPDKITLGYDQAFDEEELGKKVNEVLNKNVEIIRISKKGNYSSTQLCKNKIKK